MAKESNYGRFAVVNHLDVIIGEQIAEYESKETSGNGAGSQKINLYDVKDIARRIMKISANQVLIDDTIIFEVRKIIKESINTLECNEYNTDNNKTFICNAIAFLVFEEAKARIKSNNRQVSHRWFVDKFHIGHRNSLAKYIDIVNTSTWSETTLKQMNALQKKIIHLLY